MANYIIHGEFVILSLVHINKREFIILLSIRLKLHKFSFYFEIYRRKKINMDQGQFEEILLFFIMIFMDKGKKKKEKKQSTWVHDIFKERNQKGTYNKLIQEI